MESDNFELNMVVGHYRQYTECARQYGEIFQANQPFGEKLVVLNSVQIIKKAMRDSGTTTASLTGRPLLKASLPGGVGSLLLFLIFYSCCFCYFLFILLFWIFYLIFCYFLFILIFWFFYLIFCYFLYTPILIFLFWYFAILLFLRFALYPCLSQNVLFLKSATFADLRTQNLKFLEGNLLEFLSKN